MQIRRCGSRRDHGWKTLIRERPPQAEWIHDRRQIRLAVDQESGDSTTHEYHYQIFCSPEDVALLLEILAGPGIDEVPDRIREVFASKVGALIRLAAVASGYDTKPPAAEREFAASS